jgi:transposase-like protein
MKGTSQVPPQGTGLTLFSAKAETHPDCSARQERALMALVSQATLSAAARASGVGERTLRRWLHEDRAFQTAYRKLRSEAMRQAYARLQSACGEAVQTLRELLTLKKRPDVQARAALGILSAATRIEELENLTARIDALEARHVAGNGRKRPI